MMPATLIRQFAQNGRDRLDAVYDDLVNLPDHLAGRRKQLFQDAAADGGGPEGDDLRRIREVIAELLRLPEQLAERRGQLFRDAAFHNRTRELHEGRGEYRQIYDGYLETAEKFRSLAEQVGAPLATDLRRTADRIRDQRDELFGRWQTHHDLCAILIETVQPSAEELRDLVRRFPPPPSWCDETDDPFSAD